MSKKVKLKTEEEIALIRESSLLVGKTLGEVRKHIQPGVSTLKLDNIAEEFIRDHGGIPAFKNYDPGFADYPFPYTLCTSVNGEVVHGMPSNNRMLRSGDVISVDCGVQKNGYFGDSAYTFPVGEVNDEILNLLSVTKESLYQGIKKAVAGNRLGQISFAVQQHAERHGYSVVRELVGHGLGKQLHEPPEVPNYGRKWTGMVLKEGMVLAIEPMINLGRRFVDTGDDGWTILTRDGKPSAHFEHCVWVKQGEAEILTTFDFIEQQ